MTLAAEIVRRGAAQHADRTAVYFGDEQLTFRQVDEASNRFATHLSEMGLEKGDHVAFLYGNGLWTVPMDFAALKSGLVRVPLNTRLSLDEHARMAADADVKVIVHDSATRQRTAALIERLPGLTAIGMGCPGVTDGRDVVEDPRGAVEDPRVSLEPDDPMLLLYTSGTTGVLKAVVHSQESFGAICTNILTNLVDPEPDSVMLHAASLIHASGTFVLPYWVRGAASAVLTGFEPHGFMAALAKYHATEINLVPTMLGMLFSSGAADGADVSSLRTVIYGASPMPHPVLAEGIERWGQVFVQYYGQTEAPLCMSVLTKSDHADPGLWSACGQPAVDADVRLVDEDNHAVEIGEVGEIQVRSPFVMAGYYRADDLNSEMHTVDGWLRTRDMARRDERGYLHLVDRSSDMIITGGYNVYPREVEDALLQHEAVAEAAVVAAPDATWVEAVTAFVTLKPGRAVTEAELQDLVRAQLAGYKVPKSVHIVDTIPKSPVGKILRRALKAPLWEQA